MPKALGKVFCGFFCFFALAWGQHSALEESFRAAEEFYSRGDYRNAHAMFAQVFVQSADKDLRAKALYMKALSSYKLGDYANAASEFDEFVRIFPDHPLVHRAAIYAGNAHFELGEYLAAAQSFAFAMLSDDPREQRVAAQALEDILWGYLPIEHFPTLLDRVDRSVEGLVGVWWLRRLQHGGEYARALREGQKLLQRVYAHSDKRALQEELVRVEEHLSEHLVVAVLVPQSGDYAKYGEEVLRGVRLAFDAADVGVEVKVVDTGGDPLRTACATDRLLRSTTPLCIIGPVTSDETVAAGTMAGIYRVPLITPTASRDGIAELSPYIFQLVTSPVKASAFLAEFACDSMDTFAILAPDDDLGRACAVAFAKVAEQKQRTIIGAQFYPIGTVDFSQMLSQIKEPILQYYDSHIFEFDTTDERIYEYKPDSGWVQRERSEWLVHIDGFFLPIYFDDIEVILPQIPFMYIDARVLGANGWVIDDLERNKRLGKYLDGCLVVPDDFYICSDLEGWRSFSRAYRRRYGGSPSRVAALGYDAATLVVQGVKSGAVTQELMRDFLSGIHNFTGAAGPVAFDENGANTKTVILQFIGNQAVRVR